MLDSVLVVEDDPLVSLDITEILRDNGVKKVFVADNATDAILLLKSEEPQFALLDINLNDTHTGIDIAKIINKRFSIPFVYLTANTDDKTLEEVKKTSPVGFITKPFDEKQILASIKIGLHLYKPISTIKVEVTESFIQGSFKELTKREVVVFYHLYKGLSNLEIAHKTHVSVNTVKVHLKNIFGKIGVSSRLEAVQQIVELI